jgi:hypothetical protein
MILFVVAVALVLVAADLRAGGPRWLRDRR